MMERYDEPRLGRTSISWSGRSVDHHENLQQHWMHRTDCMLTINFPQDMSLSIFVGAYVLENKFSRGRFVH